MNNLNNVNLILVGIVLGYILFTITSSDRTKGRNKFDLWISSVTGVDINTSLKFNICDTTNTHTPLVGTTHITSSIEQ
jgi:hypothetical protein